MTQIMTTSKQAGKQRKKRGGEKRKRKKRKLRKMFLRLSEKEKKKPAAAHRVHMFYETFRVICTFEMQPHASQERANEANVLMCTFNAQAGQMASWKEKGTSLRLYNMRHFKLFKL